MVRFSRLALPSLLLLGIAGWAIPAAATDPIANSSNLDLLSRSKTGLTNSDLAFWDDKAYAGNYGGFRIFNISDPGHPRLLADVACDGPQNDVSVWDRDGNGEADLLFLSVDSVMEDDTCGSPRKVITPATMFDAGDWEGIRVFDVSDPTSPTELDPIYADCGSHTHTLVPDPDNNRVLLYVSSYPLRRGPTCGPGSTAADPLHSKIQVEEVSWSAADPLGSLTYAEPAEPEIHYPGDGDGKFDPQAHGFPETDDSGNTFNDLVACHDIGVILGVKAPGAPASDMGMAASACAEQTQLWRIDEDGIPVTADPIWVFDDPTDGNGAGGGDVAADFWHTARFTWDGKYVQADDESFGEGCPPETEITDPDSTNPGLSDTGRTHFLRVSDGERVSTFMIPRPEKDAYCSMHQGNFIPAPGRYLSVNAWYMGGADIIDFTIPASPTEIAYYDGGAHGANGSDNWSHYWYEGPGTDPGHVVTYGQDGVHHPKTGRGFETFEGTVFPGIPTMNLDHLNPQTQEFAIP